MISPEAIEHSLLEKPPANGGVPSVDGYLSNLRDEHNAETTIHWLDGLHDQFTQWEWRGGIHGSFSLEDVIAEIKRISDKADFPITRVSPDSKLAMLMAFQFAGANIPDELITPLRERAEKISNHILETTITPATLAAVDVLLQDEKKTANLRRIQKRAIQPKTKLLTPRRAALLLPTALLAITGGWVYFRSPDGQLTVPIDVPQGSVFDFIRPDNEVGASESATIQMTPTPLPNNFEADLPFDIPNVSELRSLSDQFHRLWGFNFSDTSKTITILWNSPDILAFAGGEPLKITTYPNAIQSGYRYYYDPCRDDINLDCAYATERGILYHSHSSYRGQTPLHAEQARGFLEGGSRSNISQRWSADERLARHLALEDESPMIIQGDHIAQATAVIVRIPPTETDRVYASWIRAQEDPLDILVTMALQIDPDLPNKINMNERFIVDNFCGWNIQGEPQSIQPYYQQSIYALFIGEPPAGQSP